MSERALVLGRVRRALAGGARTAELPDVPPADPTPGDLALLRARLEDYSATVATAAPGEVMATVAAVCRRHGARTLAAPAGLPDAWLPADVEALRDVDGAALSLAQLDAADGALTGCAWAVAETGTLVLDGGPTQGRRLLSLIPDLHVCVVHAEQVLADVPQLFERLGGEAATRPTTLVSGPSATSDIELHRVEGVHGPRRLEVILVAA